MSAIESRQALVPADPRYLVECQSAYEVHGTSIDRVAHNGDFLIVLGRGGARMTPRPGDLAIVTRVKGDLREVTARRVQLNGAEMELHYDLTDPRYGETSIRLGAGIDNDPYVVIDGIVVAVYRPLT